LERANLSGQLLTWYDLTGANLQYANLSGANLFGADLSGAHLFDANLRDADLSFADLSGAKGLTQKQLDEACGDADTKLPEGKGLTLKPCSTGQ
jgi:uncharacterized protein YjbI with pentapeptide repeats